jgi:hypothetical protein
MSRFFKSKKQQLPKAPEPRPLEEILKENQELLVRAGNFQYQAYVYAKEAEKINQRLVEVNHEGALRQELDRKAQEAKPKEEQKESQ